MSGYVVGSNNRILSDGTYDYEYDAEGNRTRRENISTGDYVEYHWNHRNQLVEVVFRDDEDALTKRVAYDYDAFGNLLGKRVDDDGDNGWDREERFVYDYAGKRDGNGHAGVDDLILAADGEGSLTNRYLHGQRVDELLADESLVDVSPVTLWGLTDHQGTARDIVRYDDLTEETTVTAHRVYDAFGGLLETTDPATDDPIDPESAEAHYRAGYTGGDHDPDTGLTRLGARWYDPAIGTWLSPDPIGFTGDATNHVRYVGNSPTILTDPSGHEDQQIGFFGAYVRSVRDGLDSMSAPNLGNSLLMVPGLHQSIAGVRALHDVQTAVTNVANGQPKSQAAAELLDKLDPLGATMRRDTENLRHQGYSTARATTVSAGRIVGEAIGAGDLQTARDGQDAAGNKYSTGGRIYKAVEGFAKLAVAATGIQQACARISTPKTPAQQLLQAARRAEPGITSDLSTLERVFGGKLVGLKNRFKSLTSLEEKLSVRRVPADRINDTLRYTMTFSEDGFTSGATEVMARLQRLGYEKVSVRNTFRDNATYKGINTTFKSPDGQVFELQFHTPNSYHVKQNVNHSLYEQARVLPRTDPQRAVLNNQIQQNSSAIPNPANVESIR